MGVPTCEGAVTVGGPSRIGIGGAVRFCGTRGGILWKGGCMGFTSVNTLLGVRISWTIVVGGW